MTGKTIGIGQASLLTGTDMKAWRTASDQGLLANIAPGRHGFRRYERDDLIVMAIFRELKGIGVATGFAARIASDIRSVLREAPDIEAVFVVRTTDAAGSLQPAVVITPGDDLVLVRFSIAALRDEAEAVLKAAIR